MRNKKHFQNPLIMDLFLLELLSLRPRLLYALRLNLYSVVFILTMNPTFLLLFVVE